jgi:hypothetical protein
MKEKLYFDVVTNNINIKLLFKFVNAFVIF